MALQHRAQSPLGAIRAFFRLVFTVIRDDLLGKGGAGGSSVLVRLLGIALRYPDHAAWTRTVNLDTTRQLIEAHPRFVYRYTSAYLFIGARWIQRVRMIEAHYQFVNEFYGPRFFADVLNDGVILWKEIIRGRSFSIRLSGPSIDPAHREGDMALVFWIDDLLLYKVAFSVIRTGLLKRHGKGTPSETERAIYVGQVQGAYRHMTELREATKLCRDIAPQDILMSGLAGLADAWRIERMYGVHSQRHLCAQRRPVSLTEFDYCAFWERYRGSLTPEGHYLIPLPYRHKPLEQIASKHRKRTVLKREFKKRVQEAVAQTALRRGRPQLPDALDDPNSEAGDESLLSWG